MDSDYDLILEMFEKMSIDIYSPYSKLLNNSTIEPMFEGLEERLETIRDKLGQTYYNIYFRYRQPNEFYEYNYEERLKEYAKSYLPKY